MSDGLFGPIFARGEAAAEVTDVAWLQAMLDAEAALAKACADSELIPRAAADAIAVACRAELYDIDAIGVAAAQSLTPVVPLVEALRREVGTDHAEHVHFGATSQDVIDTAAMLVAKRALRPLVADVLAVRAALAMLADEHRLTPLIGRTLLQQAEPTTFGLKAASWFSGVADAAYELVIADESGLLAAQLGGPVGTLAAFGDKAFDVAEAFANHLELDDPFISWHTARNRPADLAAAIGVLSGALSKVALDVALMSQNEIGELREASGPGRGGSSAMPHKRNPVASVAILAIGKRIPNLVATVLGAMAQEHERGAGSWQAEWEPLSQLLALSGAQLAWARELVEGLEVDVERMSDNLEAAVLAIGGDPGEIDVGSAPALVERLLSDALEED
ncbi:MAG TPA: 3-carboxy-cis,cis-muconate cycloisomerase [Baekduia sp.]|nr:3-carboxy-cis,cis-muconate cycloisomerase [Baekduia sp.]